MRLIVQRYNLDKMVILATNGGVMVETDKWVIAKAFGLNKVASVSLDPKSFEANYQIHDKLYRTILIPSFKWKDSNKKPLKISQ